MLIKSYAKNVSPTLNVINNNGFVTVSISYIFQMSTPPYPGHPAYPNGQLSLEFNSQNQIDLKAFGNPNPFGQITSYSMVGSNNTINLSYNVKDYIAGVELTFVSNLTLYDQASTHIGGGAPDIVFGSAYADQLFGNDGADYLDGAGGNDLLSGGNGADSLYGGSGTDSLYGGSGADYLEGGTDGDYLDGGADFDYATYFAASSGVLADLAFYHLNTGESAGDIYVSIEGLGGSVYGDHLRGDANANWIFGNGGDDVVFARGGNDFVFGGDGSDSLLGEGGDDTLYGGAGTDYLNGGPGADAIYGDEGVDFATYSYALTGITADLQFSSVNAGEATGDSYFSVEGVVGSNYNDNLRGDAVGNGLFGGAGNDLIFGRGGDDFIDGEAGDDYLFGEVGNDLFVFRPGSGRDTVGDFAAGIGPSDVLLISTSFGIYSFGDIQARTQQIGNDTFIYLNADTSVTLAGISASSLAANNFLFI